MGLNDRTPLPSSRGRPYKVSTVYGMSDALVRQDASEPSRTGRYVPAWTVSTTRDASVFVCIPLKPGHRKTRAVHRLTPVYVASTNQAGRQEDEKC